MLKNGKGECFCFDLVYGIAGIYLLEVKSSLQKRKMEMLKSMN